MKAVDIVVASTGFGAIREYLLSALPDAQVRMVDPAALRREGICASVLIPSMSRIDASLMDSVDGLRLIQQWGTGLEGVDIAAASARGVPVANVPSSASGNADSVAEWCVMSAIALSRQLSLLQQLIRDGTTWGGPVGRSLKGKTAVVLGLGGIGQALIQRLQPFDMRMVGIKRSADAALRKRLGLDALHTLSGLPEILPQADFLFLCLPLTPETRGLIDRRAIGLLPAHSCIINPGRGALLDEGALLDAVDGQKLHGAALDVYNREPLQPASALLKYDRILATPHIAGVTDLSYSGIAETVANNIRRIQGGKKPLHCANADTLFAQRQ